MSPTLSELQDVLDWQAVAVLRAIDERDGATADAVADAADLDRETVADRCRQLSTLGLIAEVDDESDELYDVTGAGHGAIGSGLYDEYDLVGEPDIDELAERVAELLDRRDALREEADALREDAEDVRVRAERQFGDREDVAAEFESLLSDVESLAERLSDE
ncbi:MAG: hypothetical protein ABEJ31_15730 [Haloarculaceae archaeon]